MLASDARELADEMRRTEYGQKSSEKWWVPVPDSRQKPGGEKNENGDTDGDTDGDDFRNDRRDGRNDGGAVNYADSDSELHSKSDESDVDPATAARRARSAAAAASEAEMSAEDRLLSVKARIGAACQGVLEDPEGRWTELEEVTKLAEDRDPEVARLGALSAALVFKDVCPGYRIRALTPKELAMKVTKETQKLRDFEAGLLRMYKGFVRLVVRRGALGAPDQAGLGLGLGLGRG